MKGSGACFYSPVFSQELMLLVYSAVKIIVSAILFLLTVINL